MTNLIADLQVAVERVDALKRETGRTTVDRNRIAENLSEAQRRVQDLTEKINKHVA